MCNTNGVRDRRKLLKICQQRWKSQIERFRTKNARVVWKRTCGESTFSTMKQVKSKNRNRMAGETLDDSLRLAPLTRVLINE